jgi:hypothetical protein
MRAVWVTLRVLVGIVGGYAVSAATSAALALVLHRLCGFDRAEATLLCAMLGFGLYLFVLLWAFTSRGLGRVAAVLGGGCLLGYAVVRWLSPASAIALSSFIMPIGIGG